MKLVNYNPLAEFEAMDRALDRLFSGTARSLGRAGSSTGVLPIDILEKDNQFIIKAAVPGLDPSDLDISIENNVLTIKGETKQETEEEGAKVYQREYYYGTFSRSIRLPEDLDLEKVNADFKNGFVTITLPKQETPANKAIKVPVNSSSQPALKAQKDKPDK